ncbi:BamA/TamA family outer membrane protein [Aliinostoc sp. HNIBRCY26]|uniref:BamA/TamA family outer membrane protein n=1 Tax=Aliinostoc sp. HNIBRCY26 TaxID=3418997 RepID=UPI003CFCD7E7
MRVSTVVVLVLGIFLGWEQVVLANSPADTPHGTSAGEINGYAKYGGYVEVPTTIEYTPRIVRDIQIRFMDERGRVVDDQGKAIPGRTERDFILSVLQLQPGEVFQEDTLAADLQRLRTLESVDFVRATPQEKNSQVSIIYDIKERNFPSWSFGAGSNSDIGLYGQVRYRDGNINGVNDQLTTTVQVSGKDVQFASQLISPYRADQPERFGYSIKVFRDRDLSPVFDDEIRLANGDRIREGRFGGSVALLRSFNDWDTELGLNYTRISLRNQDYDVVQQDKLGNPLSVSGTGIDDLFTVSFSVNQDRRDHPNNPTQGSILTLSTAQAIPIGLGSISSNRLQGNYVQYLPVNWLGKNKLTDNPEMVAVNFQLGTILGDFPPANAFNLGGANSVRGYGYGDLASGRSYGLASVEYRFPIMEYIGGVVFTDFASDFGSGKTVLGEPGVVRDKPGSGFGYGLGVRLNSPFGVLRGDLGVSNQGEVRLEFTTGQKF